MNNPLPFFNWSLQKALDSIPDSLTKARIRIVYTILLFAILKALIVIGFGSAAGQSLQVSRAVIAMGIYIALAKVLLYKPSSLKLLTHIMILIGFVIIWTNIFVYAHRINLPTIQFVFMIMISSFYILGNAFGITYSIISVLPVVLFLALKGNVDHYFINSPQEFASPGFEIIVTLNFISVIISHYLFFNAFQSHIKEKEILNRQLQTAIGDANKLAESKSNFLSTMSHELRTPLNSVVGITELLLEDKPEERQKENLKLLQFSAIDLLSLINNVLDFNKIDADKPELEMIPFRLADFVRNICSVLRVKATNKGLELIVDIDTQLEKITIISDPTRLSQVMYNLVGNAIKFTDRGNITVKLSVAARTEQSVSVLFSITDTGIGIHPNNHETIFELFTQGESHIIHKYGGTGLGLAIVKKVLSFFNSTIQLESSSGNGARFFFTIPFATVVTNEKSPAPRPTIEADLTQLRILIAEDNDVTRLILKKQLGKMNIQAVIVEDGQQAYEAYLSGHFDAIFMDLHMPVMDGYETIRQIRMMDDTAKANIYIIAFTASITEQEKIIEHGFNDSLYKPININELRDKLERIALHNA